MKKFTPLNDRLLIKPDEAQATVGKIVLPDEAKKRPCSGRILALSHSLDKNTFPLALGLTVFYPQFAGTDLSIDGEKYLVVDAKELLGHIGELA